MFNLGLSLNRNISPPLLQHQTTTSMVRHLRTAPPILHPENSFSHSEAFAMEESATSSNSSSQLLPKKNVDSPNKSKRDSPLLDVDKEWFGKFASIVVYAWGNTFAGHASFLMMIYPSDSITVMAVVFAGCCYSNFLRDSHPCVERAMHHDCPVCFEYLFDSIDDVTVMPCGHTIHKTV
ncbi:hypothetical protein L2E82_50472 [Cichorium intybus]|nr:hypothetical protein L2E82_50472 [Cichorium intybus]